jgi:hypothetical protein
MSMQEQAGSSQTPVPKTFSLLMIVIGVFLTLGTAALAGRLIWEMTSLTWQEGPQIVGFSLMHIIGPLPILFPFALSVWLCISLIKIIVWKLKRRPIRKQSWSVFGFAIAVIALLSLPQSFWDVLFINRLARSPHAPELLVYAAGTGEALTVRGLLKRGIPINANDREGSTALHFAARAGESKLVSYLIGKGADVNAVNLWGDSPLEGAVDNHKTETVQILSEHGAKAIKGDKEQRQRAAHRIVSRDIEEMNSQHR